MDLLSRRGGMVSPGMSKFARGGRTLLFCYVISLTSLASRTARRAVDVSERTSPYVK